MYVHRASENTIVSKLPSFIKLEKLVQTAYTFEVHTYIHTFMNQYCLTIFIHLSVTQELRQGIRFHGFYGSLGTHQFDSVKVVLRVTNFLKNTEKNDILRI